LLLEPLLEYVLALLLVVPVVFTLAGRPVRLRLEARHPASRRPSRRDRVAAHTLVRPCHRGDRHGRRPASLLAAGATGVDALILVGFGAAALVGALAALSAVSDCQMYRHVALCRDWKLLTSPAEERASGGQG